MKIVVIGGLGLIGSKTVARLRQKGHEAVAASPRSGVNTITGEGLAEALTDAQVVVDLSNSSSFEDQAVLDFFQASGRRLLAGEAETGVRHHVTLSVVGTDRLQDSGYFRGKLAQESLVRAGNIPYTIVRSTQFFEFVGSIADAATAGSLVRLSPALVQPISSDDVADAMVEAALGLPVNDIIEIAGPERLKLSALIARFLSASSDPRSVIEDPQAPYFGVRLDDASLTPGSNAHLGTTHYDSWLARSARR